MSDRQVPLTGNYLLEDVPSPGEGALTVVSTFSGGGGSSLGYRLAGIRPVGAVDIDPRMMRTYAANLDTPNQVVAPINSIPEETLKLWRGQIDILDGSPPCTTFSLAGKREADWGKARHFREGDAKQVLDQLFFDYMDLVEDLRPPVFVAENVEGMLAGNARGYVRAVVELGREHGYDVQVFRLMAGNYGVPQRRGRVFFVGRDRGLGIPRVEVPSPVRPVMTPRLAFRGVEVSGEEREALTLKTSFYKALFKYAEQGGTGQQVYREIGKAGGHSQSRLAWDKLAPSVIAGGEYYHPEEPRHLSERELLALGTFPLDYNAETRNNTKYVVGMSVPPFLIRALATQIKHSIEQAKTT